MTTTIFSLAEATSNTLSNRWALLASLTCGYLLLVRALRYRRRNSVPHRFHYYDRASWAHMTLQDAHAIQLSLAELEFPNTFSISVFFALFKTYGIPSISTLLVATGQLSSPTTASKRAADTGVIITEVVLNRPDSQRTIDGIARMNYLHGRYTKAGKISNDDMLYTLSLFLLEPIRWTSKFEWRELTDLERCAMGVYWKDLGEAMDITYEPLASSKIGWHDGLHWLEEVEAWSLQYEREKMVPAETNAKLARATFDIALFNMPASLKPMGYSFASSLLEPRLRRAMMYVLSNIAMQTITLTLSLGWKNHQESTQTFLPSSSLSANSLFAIFSSHGHISFA